MVVLVVRGHVFVVLVVRCGCGVVVVVEECGCERVVVLVVVMKGYERFGSCWCWVSWWRVVSFHHWRFVQWLDGI